MCIEGGNRQVRRQNFDVGVGFRCPLARTTRSPLIESLRISGSVVYVAGAKPQLLQICKDRDHIFTEYTFGSWNTLRALLGRS